MCKGPIRLKHLTVSTKLFSSVANSILQNFGEIRQCLDWQAREDGREKGRLLAKLGSTVHSTMIPEKFPPARVYIIFLILRKEVRRKEQAAKARQILAAACEKERNVMKKVDGKLPEILTGIN